jgi:hypothetical protein
MRIVVEADDESENEMCDWFKDQIGRLRRLYEEKHGDDKFYYNVRRTNVPNRRCSGYGEYRPVSYTDSYGNVFVNGEKIRDYRTGLCGSVVTLD